MNRSFNPGSVIIAGAGPGDPDLITVRAAAAIGLAEVIVTDRLVSEELLARYAQPDALVLHAGKQRGRAGSTPQTIINELLVDYARQGKRVLRLKGGDVSVFSNILDELEALREAGIAYELIPGVTAAAGAAASAGIPLTARGHGDAVRILTLHRPELFDEKYWRELAQTSDTLVFYMSGENTNVLVDRLIAQGIAPDRHVAVVEQATTPAQRVTTAPIHAFAARYRDRPYDSPALVIVGRVARLHERFRWQEPASEPETYFKPVAQTKETIARA